MYVTCKNVNIKEGLGKLMKIIHLIGPRTHDLLACSVAPEPLHYCVPPININNGTLFDI
jgi:hypothetical protein